MAPPTVFRILSMLTLTSTMTSAMSNLRPVFEQSNERMKSDTEKVQYLSAPTPDIYSNPLAASSKMLVSQKARMHIQNQQAMFLAERTRQQRAQLQRNIKPVDSYMRAYHEEQEKHQRELERQQATINQQRTKQNAPAVTQKPNPNTNNIKTTRTRQRFNEIKSQRITKSLPQTITPSPLDPINSMEAESSPKRSRNQRSHAPYYGNFHNDNNPYSPNRIHNYGVQKPYFAVTASPTYMEQGVTINPHSNTGVKYGESKETEKLNTFPKTGLYTHTYPSTDEKESQTVNLLGALLKPSTHEQIPDFNEYEYVLNQDQYPTGLEHLGQNIKVVYYGTPEVQSLVPQDYEAYGSAFDHQKYKLIKDHTPITEHIQDVADTRKPVKLNTFSAHTVIASDAPPEATTKSNNYYKVDVASETINRHVKSNQNYLHNELTGEPAYDENSDNVSIRICKRKYGCNKKSSLKIRIKRDISESSLSEVTNTTNSINLSSEMARSELSLETEILNFNDEYFKLNNNSNIHFKFNKDFYKNVNYLNNATVKANEEITIDYEDHESISNRKGFIGDFENENVYESVEGGPTIARKEAILRPGLQNPYYLLNKSPLPPLEPVYILTESQLRQIMSTKESHDNADVGIYNFYKKPPAIGGNRHLQKVKHGRRPVNHKTNNRHKIINKIKHNLHKIENLLGD